MKYQIMTDGYYIQVVHKLSLEYFKSIGWMNIGFRFDDWKQANEYADQLAAYMG